MSDNFDDMEHLHGAAAANEARQQFAANVPTTGGKGRFNALERAGQAYQPPPLKPAKPAPESK